MVHELNWLVREREREREFKYKRIGSNYLMNEPSNEKLKWV